MIGLLLILAGIVLMGIVLWLCAPQPVEMTERDWLRYAVCGTCDSPSCAGCTVAIRRDLR